jgi:ABC-2 type transport system ATP-binding protein
MLLTTQYLEEADRFADAVHVLDHGLIIATGTASELKTRTGTQVVDVLLAGQDAAAAKAALATRLAPADLHVDAASRRLTIVARDGLGTLLTAARVLSDDRIEVADIALRQPSLDEAFLALTSVRPPSGEQPSGGQPSGGQPSGEPLSGGGPAGTQTPGPQRSGVRR